MMRRRMLMCWRSRTTTGPTKKTLRFCDARAVGAAAGRSVGTLQSMPPLPVGLCLDSSQPYSSANGWNPDFIKGKHQDAETMEWHQVLVILLPSGVGQLSTQDVDLGLEANGTVLAIQHVWPEWITNRQYLYFLKQALLEQAKPEWKSLLPTDRDEAEDHFRETFALMAHSLRTQMAAMRPDPMLPILKSTARIVLDFAVKPITANDWLFIGNDDGVRLLYVNLKAPTETSYEAKHVKDLLMAKHEKPAAK